MQGGLKKLVWAAVVVLLAFGAMRLISGDKSVAAGTVMGLGANASAQLGGDNAAKAEGLKPLVLNEETGGHHFASAKAGHYYTLLLTQDGRVFALGNNLTKTIKDSNVIHFPRPVPIGFEGLAEGETITQIDASRDHNLALTSAGRVFAWGANGMAQLGYGENQMSGKPTLVAGLPKITGIAAGYRHSAAIAEDGSVWGWGGKCTDTDYSAAKALLEQAGGNITGLGAYGSMAHQEGGGSAEDCTTQDSTFVQSKTPQKLDGLHGHAKAISAGYGHVLVLTEKGEVFSAGCNTYGQLGRDKPQGDGRNNLAKVELPGAIQSVAAGYRHSLALTKDGKLLAWGYNGDGHVLGVASTEPAVKKPASLAGDPTFRLIEAAHDTSFALTTENQLLGWGQDDAAAFWPNGTTRDRQDFGKVERPALSLSAGMRHLLALVEN